MGLATVRTAMVPLYERPTAESVLLDEVLYGMSVQVIDESAAVGWCYLRTEYGAEGYAHTAGLQMDAEMAASWRRYKKVTVMARYIDVQQRAEANAPCIASATCGGILVALGSPGTDGWQKVGLVTGERGYTRASYLDDVITDWTQLAEDEVRYNIVQTARFYEGTTYRSGGRTPLGIDAVGLAAMSYYMNGIVISRLPFFKAGGTLRKMRFEDMDEGDLLYFHEGIGIYIGKNRFIHATDIAGGEGVAINSLRPRDKDYRGDLAGHLVAVAGVF